MVAGLKTKSVEEIRAIRAACKIAAEVLREICSIVQPGLTTIKLDEIVGQLIVDRGGTSAFLGYRGFPRNCCISINEGVVHGIATTRRIQFGDLVKIDVGVRFNGFVGDVAMSLPAGGCSPLAAKLMHVTTDALYLGIAQARPGNRVTDISRAIQEYVESNGFSIVREFVGHGVGRSVHEEPQIPNYVDHRHAVQLVPGLVIATEPMVNAGGPGIELLGDQWTVITKDRKLSAHFEHSVLITDNEAEILTRDGMTPLY